MSSGQKRAADDAEDEYYEKYGRVFRNHLTNTDTRVLMNAVDDLFSNLRKIENEVPMTKPQRFWLEACFECVGKLAGPK